MKRIKNLSSLIVAVLIFNGCATHENFIKQQDSWNGQSIVEYIKVVGYPDSSYDLPNGNKVYIYTKKRQNYNSGFQMGFSGVFGSRIGRNGYIGIPMGFGFPMGYGGIYEDEIVTTCQLFIETTKTGKIIRWSSKGSGCVANEIKQ